MSTRPIYHIIEKNDIYLQIIEWPSLFIPEKYSNGLMNAIDSFSLLNFLHIWHPVGSFTF